MGVKVTFWFKHMGAYMKRLHLFDARMSFPELLPLSQTECTLTTIPFFFLFGEMGSGFFGIIIQSTFPWAGKSLSLFV